MTAEGFVFDVEARDGAARAGRFTTPHGVVETPCFMPVGTKATVKAVEPRELRELGAQVVLANTYHLFFRPGTEVVVAHGGLHGFMQWDGPILTDSGGYQVFSLEGTRVVRDDGVEFSSVYDGSRHVFTPELVMRAQEALGADVIMMLRVQLERIHEPTMDASEYFQFYGLRLEHLGLAKPDVIVLHPGPINRGREISSEVADSQRSMILNQVENGIAVRMAVLERVLLQ